MGKQIICIGSSCKDIFFPTAEGIVTDTPEDLMAQKKITFELGAKYKIENRAEALGGCAANVAVGLAKLGIKPACYSHIGDDLSANWIKEQLKKEGVDTSLITHEKNFPSDLSAIVIDKGSGDRVIFSNQKANGKLRIVAEEIKDTGWFFIGDLHGDWEKHLDEIYKVAAENDIKVANNPRQINLHDNPKKILEIIPKSDVLFLNKDESIEVLLVTGEKYSKEELDDEIFLAKKLQTMSSGVVSITDGVRGAWATDGEKIVFAPGIKVNALDTTGAGDSFTSGFLAAHMKGKALEECVRWGIANSSNEVQFYGSIEGLLGEEKILIKIKEVRTENLS
jgi:sugar/nucleoside kinase (ribokinase family)